jgi:hypothetical protein
VPYRGECGRCGSVIFGAAERVREVEVDAMQAHLWESHPDISRPPSVLPLAQLLRVVHVRME